MSLPIEEVALSELPSRQSLLQSRTWARFKSEFGWTAHAFRPTAGPWARDCMLVLRRDLAPGVSLGYVPYAPALPDPGGDPASFSLCELGSGIAAALPGPPTCVRFDLLWPAGSVVSDTAALRKAAVDVQPPSTVLLSLEPQPDELLAGMHKKNRYNIRLAERKGVTVRLADPGGSDDLERWHELYRETAARDRISIHPQRYYRRLFDLSREVSDLQLHLYLAEHDGTVLAGVIVAELGDQATYLYGASSNLKRELMPNYALQWAAISNARERNLSTYDFFGIPPADNPEHPMHGLYRFKTGFGGEIVHRAGSWDVVIRPLRYRAYSVAERARSFYFHQMRKAGAR